MGAEPYDYVVEYEPDVQAALAKLRQRVFESGEYRGAERNPPSPEAALEMTEDEGTASILDIMAISEAPDYCCAAPLSEDELHDCFGTAKPTKEMVRACEALWNRVDRGMARYVILHEGDEPRHIYFFGYSFD